MAQEKKRLLRQERQSEYLDYMKRRDGRKGAVSKIRSELSLHRESELNKNQGALASRRDVANEVGTIQEKSKSDYASVRAKAFAQERQYTNGSLGLPEQFKKEDGASQTQLGYVTPHFQNGRPHHDTSDDMGYVDKREQRKAWDDEERDLLQWTRSKAIDRRQNVSVPRLDSRNMSSHNAVPLPGWGKSYSDEQKEHRMKQKQYAEDLQRQMNDKVSAKNLDDVYADERGRARGYNAEQHLGGKNAGSQYSGHVQDRFPKPEPVPTEEIASRPREPSSYDHPLYSTQYPPYPYPPPAPLPPGYQVPPGGPWAPPRFANPYPQYRHDQDHETRPQMYYQPYYFSPPRDRPSSRTYAPVPTVLNPYNMPSRRDNSHGPLESYSHRGKVSIHDRAGPAKSQYSPPNSFQSRKDKSHYFGMGEDRPPANDKMEYRRQLEQQVREKKARDREEKLSRERDEMKKMEIYDPFGKGGCGAPVRDQHGNLVADLKQMRKINENRLSNNSVKVRSSSVMRSGSKDSSRADSPSDSPDKSTEHTILTYNKRDTEATKKNTQDSYRDYLRQQVLEKEKLKKEEKEKQRLEELKQLEQLERDRKKIQTEYQQELERQRKKEEELKKKNEAIKLEAERERHKVLMQQQQQALQEEEERRKMAERELEKTMTSPRAVPSQRTTWSPPVPTLIHQMKLGAPGLIPRAETFTEAPRLPLQHPQNPARRSNERKLENAASDDSFVQSTPAVPWRGTSPPVPALRKKLSQTNTLKQEGTSKQTTGARSFESTTDKRSENLSSRQVLPNRSGGSRESAMLQRQPQSQGNTNEILTKLGALRMYLQEELAKQQTESSSEIFERVKQQRPGLAVPVRPKGSNTTVQTTIAKRGSHENVLAGGSTAAISHQLDSSDRLRSENGSVTSSIYRGLPKKNSSDTLLSKKSVPSVRPWGNSLLAQSSKRGESSLRGDKAAAGIPSRYRDRRQGSPSTLSKLSVNTVTIDTMAERTEERMRRLDAILKSQEYGGESSLDGQSIDSRSVALRHGREEHDGRSMQYGHSQGLLAGSQGFPRLLSRNSEQSLECDTRHLPIQ